jgi:outer membrane lipoprotein SlyB
MTKILSALILMVFAGLGLVTNSQTTNKPTTNDVKIRQRMSSGGVTAVESLLYIKGQRMRSEMPGSMGFTSIMQCDLKRTITINERTKTYLIASSDGSSAASTGEGDGGGAPVPPAATQQPPAQPRGGLVNITNTITDTGERKEMFGFTARRIKTSFVKTASAEACDKDQKVETDGWYIDFQYAFECPTQGQKHQPYVPPQRPGCKDEIRTKTIGSAKMGFPVLVTTTIYQPDGRTSTMTQEVLELSREPLAASLFDVPAGYTLAKDNNELYGISTAGTAAAAYNPRPDSSAASTTSTTANTSNVANSSTPKKPGVIRIGIMLPKVQLTSGGDATQAAETLRKSFAGYLNAPTIEVVTLSAQFPAQALEEARQSQCDYILSASMNVKKGGGGSMFGKAIGNIAGSAAGHIPGGGSATTGAARSAAITGVYTTAAIASTIKAKDELSLEYKLDSVETSKTVLSNTAKAKAKSDGEDIVTPTVETSARTIVATVTKK